MYGGRLLKTIVYNDSREWRPICRSRCLNLTASGRASRCGSAPTAISSSPWKTTGGECERIFVRASKSGSSKVGAIAVWKRKLSMAEIFGRSILLAESQATRFEAAITNRYILARSKHRKYPHVRHEEPNPQTLRISLQATFKSSSGSTFLASSCTNFRKPSSTPD
jgi:hypothetical protein